MTQAANPTSSSELRDIVRDQLQLLLEQKNYEGAKMLLVPVPPVDIAESLGRWPQPMLYGTSQNYRLNSIIKYPLIAIIL